MRLRTLARDCLYLNWALPLEVAPPLPRPLRYEIHHQGDREWVFASALLFRLSGLRLQALPMVGLSYPQMNLRLYVLDGNGAPSVLFVRMLVPAWVAPLTGWFARQPSIAARLAYPHPSRDLEAESWSWRLRANREGTRGKLEVHARMASPWLGAGPNLGGWQKAVDHFRHRAKGYVVWEDRLRRVTTSHPEVEVWPLEVELAATDLLENVFSEVDPEVWRIPHSAWLCPEIPFLFELGRPKRVPMLPRMTAAEGC